MISQIQPIYKPTMPLKKIVAETRAEDMSSLLCQANSQAGKVSISPEYDKCGAINKVDFTFHPLFSLRQIGKDLSISLPHVAECTPKPQKR